MKFDGPPGRHTTGPFRMIRTGRCQIARLQRSLSFFIATVFDRASFVTYVSLATPPERLGVALFPMPLAHRDVNQPRGRS